MKVSNSNTKRKSYKIRKSTKNIRRKHNKGSRTLKGGQMDGMGQGQVMRPELLIKKKEPFAFTVEYPSLGILQDMQDLTGKSTIYQNAPIVKLQNANPNRDYLLTMYDPDAPNGIENKMGNHIHTHWVAKIGSGVSSGSGNDNILQTFLEYAPPTPPNGTHRYIFTIYDITSFRSIRGGLDFLKMSDSVGDGVGVSASAGASVDRTNYFRLKLQNLKQKKMNFNFRYIVKA